MRWKFVKLLNRIVRGRSEECCGGLLPLYVRQTVACFAHTRVFCSAEDDDLQFGRKPFFGDGTYGALIAHGTGGNGCCDALTVDHDPFDRSLS